MHVLRKLNETETFLYISRIEKNMSYDEIAPILGMKSAAIRKRYEHLHHRVLQEIKEILKNI